VVGFAIKLELRDLARVRALIWELRQLESRLRVAAHPEAENLERIIDRLTTDLTDDEPLDD
jgi:hypothetical protein